jgi:hypothetical protein
MKYSIEQFLNDLTKIKNNTVKASIIRHVFEQFEMWSINKTQCIKQLKHFNKHVETTKFILSLLRQTRDLIDIQHELKKTFIGNSRFERALVDAANATLVVIVVSIHVSNHCSHCQTSVSRNHIVWSVITLIIRFATENNHHVVRIRDDFYFDLKSSIIIIDNVLFIRSFFIIERFDHVKSIASFWFVAFLKQTAWCLWYELNWKRFILSIIYKQNTIRIFFAFSHWCFYSAHFHNDAFLYFIAFFISFSFHIFIVIDVVVNAVSSIEDCAIH